MRTKTFKKGIKVPHNKFTVSSPLVECPTPDVVYIPMCQHIGKPAAPIVTVGQRVKAGTLIGKADGFVSANIFSSVSGVVIAVEKRKTPFGAPCDHVVVENDGKNETESLPTLTDRSRESVLRRIQEAGIVGLGGAGFPSHVKYAPKTPVDTYIINAAECEPYITCDHRLLLEYTEAVLRGAMIFCELLGLKRYFIGIEDNKSDAVAELRRKAAELGIPADVVVLKSKYPQGAEKQMIYAVTGRKVPTGGLPSDVGVVVGNVHTAYSAYHAVEHGTPLYMRATTVCGGGIQKPANLWVRTGTLYSHCIEFCGGEKTDCVKTVSGGPMMGFALDGGMYSVTKTTGALLFLSAEEAHTSGCNVCINCGKCAKACPMNLMPMYIDLYTQRGDYRSAVKYGALNCIECGCCAYSCPSKRQIVQSVKLCKKKIKESV